MNATNQYFNKALQQVIFHNLKVTVNIEVTDTGKSVIYKEIDFHPNDSSWFFLFFKCNFWIVEVAPDFYFVL